MAAIHVFCDFDGTVTTRDTLELILERHASPAWRVLEDEMRSGRLAEAEGLGRQMALVAADEATALATIDREVAIEPGFAGFLRQTRGRGIAVTILSGGFARLIRRVLARLAEPLPEVRANDYLYDGSWRVAARPHRSACPGCNHCKALALLEARRRGLTTVMVGDGITDLCAAFEADLVLARATLAELCGQMGRAHRRFTGFDEVTAAVLELAAGARPPGPATTNPIMARHGFDRARLLASVDRR